MQKISPSRNIISNYSSVIHKSGRRITIYARLRQAKDGRYHWCYDRKDVEKRVAAHWYCVKGTQRRHRLNGSISDCTFPPFLASPRFFDTCQEALWYGDYRNPANQLFYFGKVDDRLTMNAFSPENREFLGLTVPPPQLNSPAECLDSAIQTPADQTECLIF